MGKNRKNTKLIQQFNELNNINNTEYLKQLGEKLTRWVINEKKGLSSYFDEVEFSSLFTYYNED